MEEEYDLLYLAYRHFRNLVAVGVRPQRAAIMSAEEFSRGNPEMLLVLTEALREMATAVEQEGETWIESF